MTSIVGHTDVLWKKKRDGARSSITLVVLGDEGVGKSSLISSFVSRRFSPTVPGIMTRVRLPPEQPTFGPSSGGGGCTTTIVDTQNGDSALMAASMMGASSLSMGPLPPSLVSLGSATGCSTTKGGSSPSSSSPSSSSEGIVSGIRVVMTGSSSSVVGGSSMTGVLENLDAIVLVYDLGREGTFDRLEQHWLPLIEQCYGEDVPVIITGNKIDLDYNSSTSITSAPQTVQLSRQRIVSLLQRFKSIRQSIKCSAKTLVNVNDVFLKARHAVLYPINPLYDLFSGQLSPSAVRAFTRLFRMHDVDRDGLLSNEELNAFQASCVCFPRRGGTSKLKGMMEGDLVGWKKLLMKTNPEEKVIVNGKFTLQGFLTMFDMFINSNRLEIPWMILRAFGYDNDLRLIVPDSVLLDGDKDSNSPIKSSWRLSQAVEEFLNDTFQQFDNDNSGVLSVEDLLHIFSISPEPSLPPWHQHQSDADDTSSPTKTEATLTPLSYLDWMSYWHTLSATSHPSVVRSELFHLGFTYNSGGGKLKKQANKASRKKIHAMSPDPPQIPLRIALFQHDTLSPNLLSLLRNENTPYCANMQLNRDTNDALTVHFIFVNHELFVDDYRNNNGNEFDLIVLGYDPDSIASWDACRQIESSLSDDTPRLYISLGDSDNSSTAAKIHCTITEIEPPLSVTTHTKREAVLDHIARCGLGEKKARPHSERRRREALRKKMLWLGGLVGVGMAVVVVLLGGRKDTKAGNRGAGGWLRSWFH